MKLNCADRVKKRLKEGDFALFIAERAHLELIRAPANCGTAYALMEPDNRKVVAWLDVWCKYSNSDSEFMVSVTHWMAGIKLAKQSGKPYLIGFRCMDGDFLIQIQTGYFPMVPISLPEHCECTKELSVRVPKYLFHTLAHH